ncbi:hypothetical protein GH808_03735 [Acetobacterium fimetarium]|uniref:Uncharacterized protein n=1 Tax=Acetobacterium fimetarium TaxID=52691 RepID=A0ABR6WSF4_9FIRM|nr:hypothetical protein [Acetobacterium fimetarium]MBC3803547.1 hypothetical protein [Acetobacterium fimetarium]
MITYSTQFPVNDKLDKKTFVEYVIRWNQGSKYDKLDNLEWDEESFSVTWEDSVKKLIIEELEQKGIIASRFQKEDNHGLWKTDFILNYGEYITIRVELETTESTTDFYPSYYPPFFVKQIIYWGFAAEDGSLPVGSQGLSLDTYDKYIRDILEGKENLWLPIVFVSKKSDGDYPVNISDLAFKLQGVAHTIYEDKNVGITQYAERLDCNGARGSVIIVYPNKYMKRKVINPFGANSENPDKVLSLITNAVYEYSNQVMRLDTDTWDGMMNAKLHFQNSDLLSGRSILEEENTELYEVFEEQLHKTEEANKNLNLEIQRLTVENQALRMRLASKDQKPLLYMGEEIDFYEGEIREIILEILETCLRNTPKGTRRDHIVTDLLENNIYDHIPAKRREQIKVALKGYKTLGGSLKSLLGSMGFIITDDGKHYKWTYFGDHRYSATVAKTSSDHRAGMNMASLIDNLML